MKRLPLFVSLILFVALCASAAYWAMQLFKPPVRPVAAQPQVQPEVNLDAAAALFGGRAGAVVVASNYQLKGVIDAHDAAGSAAILSADGKPAQSLRIGDEVTPGVTVKEVHGQYVLLSDGGVTKRVELPESADQQGNPGTAAPMATTTLAPGQPNMMQPGNLNKPAPDSNAGFPQPRPQPPAPSPGQPNVMQPGQPNVMQPGNLNKPAPDNNAGFPQPRSVQPVPQ
ncbi:type II secretion system protein N [Undibacterium arcticum]|uniref:Type II secretion system protein N n=1 Tax=Undibacterium arcticum TaxID=1762892 RepID=A0ABV7EYL1_9BURK